MFSSLRNFLSRHKKKFVVGGLLVGGFVVLTQYTQRKLREWQEKEVRELVQRTRRSQHFETMERSCNQTISQLSICLRRSVIKALDTESVVEKLRKGCDDKVVCWMELKSLAITRSAVIIYSTTMLVVLLRIQFNIVGGLMFKHSQDPENCENIEEAQTQEYLTLSTYFMSEGIEKLSRFVREKVDNVTSSISLKDKLTLQDLAQIYWSIASSVTADSQRDPMKNMSSYMIDEESRQSTNPVKARMIQEMVDLLESEEVQNLTRTTISGGFALLIDHLSDYFVDSLDTQCVAKANGIVSNGTKDAISLDNGLTNGYINRNKVTISMAKIIPIINGQFRDSPKNGDIASDWLQTNITNEKFKTLAANIYEAFSF